MLVHWSHTHSRDLHGKMQKMRAVFNYFLSQRLIVLRVPMGHLYIPAKRKTLSCVSSRDVFELWHKGKCIWTTEVINNQLDWQNVPRTFKTSTLLPPSVFISSFSHHCSIKKNNPGAYVLLHITGSSKKCNIIIIIILLCNDYEYNVTVNYHKESMKNKFAIVL